MKKALAYFTGNYRYWVWYSRFKGLLLRSHIIEEIDTRIASMDPDCYSAGECKMCGCTTTALQMANKACDKPCYPEMVNKKTWEMLKAGCTVDISGGDWYLRGTLGAEQGLFSLVIYKFYK